MGCSLTILLEELESVCTNQGGAEGGFCLQKTEIEERWLGLGEDETFSEMEEIRVGEWLPLQRD